MKCMKDLCMLMKKVSNNVHSRINNWRLYRSNVNVHTTDK